MFCVMEWDTSVMVEMFRQMLVLREFFMLSSALETIHA